MTQEISHSQSLDKEVAGYQTILAEFVHLSETADKELLLLSDQATSIQELNFRVQKLADYCQGMAEICERLEKMRNDFQKNLKNAQFDGAQAEEQERLCNTIAILLDEVLAYRNNVQTQIAPWQESVKLHLQKFPIRSQKVLPEKKHKSNNKPMNLADLMKMEGLGTEIAAATGVVSALTMKGIGKFWGETVAKITTKGEAKIQKDRMIQQAMVLLKSNTLIDYCYLNKEFAEFVLLKPYAYGITEKEGFKIALCHHMVSEAMWKRAGEIDLSEKEAFLAILFSPKKKLKDIMVRVKMVCGDQVWQAHGPWPIQLPENAKESIADFNNYLEICRKSGVNKSSNITKSLSGIKEKSVLKRLPNLLNKGREETPGLEAKRESLRNYFIKRYAENGEQIATAFLSPRVLYEVLNDPHLKKKLIEKIENQTEDAFGTQYSPYLARLFIEFHEKWCNHKDYALVKDFVLRNRFLNTFDQYFLALKYEEVANYYMEKSALNHWALSQIANLALANKKFSLYLATNPDFANQVRIKNINQAHAFSWTYTLFKDLEIAKLAATVDHMGFDQLNREQLLELANKGLAKEIFERCVRNGRWLEYTDYCHLFEPFGFYQKIKPCLTLDDWMDIAKMNPILAEGILTHLGNQFNPKQKEKLLAYVSQMNLMAEQKPPTEKKENKEKQRLKSLVCSSSFSSSSSSSSNGSSSSSTSSNSSYPEGINHPGKSLG